MGKKPTKLLCDDITLVKWLTSNPQHFDPRNAISVHCPSYGPLALPWPIVPEGINDPADIRGTVKRLIAKPPADPKPELPPFLTRKQLPKPNDDPADLA